MFHKNLWFYFDIYLIYDASSSIVKHNHFPFGFYSTRGLINFTEKLKHKYIVYDMMVRHMKFICVADVFS